MSETKLKPCPFCGGRAQMNYAGERKLIICSECLIHTEPYDTYEKAAEAWNRRAYNENVCTKYLPNNGDDLCINDGMGASGCNCRGEISRCDYGDSCTLFDDREDNGNDSKADDEV